MQALKIKKKKVNDVDLINGVESGLSVRGGCGIQHVKRYQILLKID